PTEPPCEIPVKTWTPIVQDGGLYIDPSAPNAIWRRILHGGRVETLHEALADRVGVAVQLDQVDAAEDVGVGQLLPHDIVDVDALERLRRDGDADAGRNQPERGRRFHRLLHDLGGESRLGADVEHLFIKA